MIKRLWTRLTSINIPLALAALFASGILHILATLATPMLTPTSAYGRLAGDLPQNTMQVLPDIMPDTQPLPFFTADAQYALCRFDTTDGAVSLTAVLPEPGWTLALYAPSGANFFTSVAAAGRRPEVAIVLVPGESTRRDEPSEDAEATSVALTIRANKGLAVIRAPDRGEAYRARATAELKRAKCSYRRQRPS